MAAAGVPVIPGVRAPGSRRRGIARAARRARLPAAGQGVGRRRRQGHARRARRGRRSPAALAAARREAQARLRRRHAAGRALLRRAAPRRDPDLRRRARPRRAPASSASARSSAATRRSSRRRRRRRVDAALRARMGAAAVAAGARHRLRQRRHGRVRPRRRDGQFYFLEVNTRLQVEHPVTEAITGLDLVRLQIRGRARARRCRFAQDDLRARRPRDRGAPLRRGPGARLPAVDRHASSSGQPPALPGVRCDSGVEAGHARSSVHYDPMLAKVIAHAPTRAEAVDRLTRALARLARRRA